MIDFHSHILPGIDDGAKDRDESLKMLNSLREQGVLVSCLTPHYMASEENILSFTKRRDEAFLQIKDFIPGGMKVILGAEVYICPELLEDDVDFSLLALGQSRAILFEMPFAPWQKWMFDVFHKAEKNGFSCIVAHAERYTDGRSLFKYNRFFELENTYIQINADSFFSLFRRRIIKKFIKKGAKILLGSDAHDTEVRKVEIERAGKIILSKFGEKFLEDIINNGKQILKNI